MDNNTSLFSDPFTTSARDRLHYKGATIVAESGGAVSVSRQWVIQFLFYDFF